KVVTKGTPQQIIKDPVAINEYLGNSFTQTVLGSGMPPLPEKKEEDKVVFEVVEQEKVHRLIERLKTDDHAAAAAELVQRGAVVLPALLETLERRDVEIRRLAFEIVQRLLNGSAVFDPYAPEPQRRQQLALLRESLERKAG